MSARADRTAFDVIVLGGGLAGGLPAATYLQRAGARVAVVERGIDAGRFYLSYELFPGVLLDHSPVNFSGLSPVIEDLELRSLGYTLQPVEIAYSTIDRNGRSMTVFADPRATEREVAHHSRRDAASWSALARRLDAVGPRLLELVFFTPHPDSSALDEAIELTATLVGAARRELEQLTAPELVATLFEADFIRRSVMALPALNLFGDLLVPGQGSLAWAWTMLMRARTAPTGNQSLVKALETAFLQAGGTLLRNTSAVQLLVESGRCTGVVVQRGERSEVLHADRAVISNLGARYSGKLLAVSESELALPEQPAFFRKLAGWSTGQRTIATHDFVLRRPLHWPGDASGTLRRSPRLYLLWDSFKDCQRWLERVRANDLEVYFDDVELTQFHAIYPGPREDLLALRARYGTGPYLDADGAGWDERRQQLAARMRELLAHYDPTFTQAIAFEQVSTPLDYWRGNPAAASGNPVGGDVMAGQWVSDRLPYRTPVAGLYCSNSVWPPGLSVMGSGYNAASIVARDLGLEPRAAAPAHGGRARARSDSSAPDGAAFAPIFEEGGVDALVAAAYLARAGRRPLVLERGPRSGGDFGTESFTTPFRFDLGPALLFRPAAKGVFAELELERRGVELIEPEVPLALDFGEGRCFRLCRDWRRTAEQLASGSERDRFARLIDDGLVLRSILLDGEDGSPASGLIEALAALNVRALLDRYRLEDPALRCALAYLPVAFGFTVEDAGSGIGLAFLLASLARSAIVRGGNGVLCAALSDLVIAGGGEVRQLQAVAEPHGASGVQDGLGGGQETIGLARAFIGGRSAEPGPPPGHLVVTGFASEQDVYAHLKAVKSARLPRLAGHVARRPEAGPQLRPGSGDRHERLSSLVWQGPMPQGAELSGQLLDECCVAALGSAPLEQVTFRLLWMPSHTGAALQAPDWAQLLAGKWGREKPSAALSAATGLHPGRELYLALTATGPAADARSGRR